MTLGQVCQEELPRPSAQSAANLLVVHAQDGPRPGIPPIFQLLHEEVENGEK